MEKIKVAIVGYGNIGQYALQAVQAAEDMELVGVIRHSAQAQQPKELEGICVVDSVEKLPAKPQVALLCLPTRSVEENAKEYLAKGINTVDSFDIHTQIWQLHCELDKAAKASALFRSSLPAGTRVLTRWFVLFWKLVRQRASPIPTLDPA